MGRPVPGRPPWLTAAERPCRGADPARRDPRGRSAAFHARAAGHPHLAARLDAVVDQEKTIW
jgi:hypothetical protein